MSPVWIQNAGCRLASRRPMRVTSPSAGNSDQFASVPNNGERLTFTHQGSPPESPTTTKRTLVSVVAGGVRNDPLRSSRPAPSSVAVNV